MNFFFFLHIRRSQILHKAYLYYKKLFAVYLKFKFSCANCILSGKLHWKEENFTLVLDASVSRLEAYYIDIVIIFKSTNTRSKVYFLEGGTVFLL